MGVVMSNMLFVSINQLADKIAALSTIKWPVRGIARFNGPSQVAEDAAVSSRNDGKQRILSATVNPCQNRCRCALRVF
jgi:hypothetical protein